jgi:branched-chain amino acid transport system permease protein
VDVFLQHAWNGLAVGSIYALIALGYTMVYGVLKFINFAHSEVFMTGAFAGFYAYKFATHANPALGQAGPVTLAAVLFIAMAACTALGFVIERLAYRPLRNAPRLNSLITAIGVSLLLQNLGQNIYGAAPQSYPRLLEPKTWSFLLAPDGGGGVYITRNSVVVLSVAILLMILLQWIVFGTKTGTAMRAVSENGAVAGLLGVNTGAIVTFTFLLGASLAGAGGVLYGLSYPQIDPIMGMMPGLKAFVAAVLGGIGSVRGAMLGGIVIGLSEEAIVGLGYSTWRDGIAFSILILILLFYPTGLFGRVEPEKV